MVLIRRIVKYAYLCLMCLGALAAAFGILSAIRSIAPDGAQFPGSRWWDHPVLQYGVTGIVLLLMTLAFFVIFIRRGTHLLAPLPYIVGYAANAFGFSVWLIDIEKRGAPGPVLTVADACLEAAMSVVPALLLTAVGLIWNYKAASRSHAL